MNKIPLPLQLLLMIPLALVIHYYLPDNTTRCLLTCSITLKEILMFMLPLVIFSTVYTAFVNINNSGKLVLLLIAGVILSNFISLTIGAIFNYMITFNNHNYGINVINASFTSLKPLFELKLPKFVPNEMALLMGVILGFFNFKNKIVILLLKSISKVSNIFLNNVFIPLLPIFILGFLTKLLSENIFYTLISFNLVNCIMMIILLLIYLTVLLIGATTITATSVKTIAGSLINPVVTAFSTTSSAAALPFSLQAAAQNTKNTNLSNLVMPITVNIHMIGDSICIPVMAAILIMAFGTPVPTYHQYAIFMVTFLITKFSGAGVPGGSMLVMLPVLEKNLGFSSEMLAVITAFYMLMDPITTMGNVMGNNLFIIYFNKLVKALRIQSDVPLDITLDAVSQQV